ncbi:wnt family protein [Trichuris suis]|nr:wnt family protein [Trichuris suis]
MIASTSGSTECSDPPSYTFYSWKRLKGVAVALLQTEQHVKQLKEEIESRLNSRRTVDALFCQVEHGRSSLKQLSVFLERQRNSVKASSNRLHQVRCSLEQKRATIDRLEVEIERDRVGHDEKLRDYIAHREQLVWVNAQLTLRRKEMTNRVGEIFVVQRMATTSKPRCGCNPLYRIVGLHLPDAEKYIRHSHMEVSTALGHTAQLVSVLSRIFNLPLRYPIRLFGSRSAVWDPYMRSESGPRAHIFPLFSRHQDKLMFEYGVFLLNKNIAQLRRSLGLPTSDLRCTLANVALLLEHLTEVPLDSDASSSSLRPPMSPASSQGSWSTTGTWTSENSRGIRSVGANSQWIVQPISVDRSCSLPLLYQHVVAEACNGGLFDRELNNDPSTAPLADDSIGQQHSEGKFFAGCPDVLHWVSAAQRLIDPSLISIGKLVTVCARLTGHVLCSAKVHDKIRWRRALGHGKQIWNQSYHCPRHRAERKRYGLIGAQTKLCKRHADLMPIIMKAASLTVTVCQQQFKDNRWNCSSVKYVPKLTPDLTKGTREQALVYALSAAAVTHGIAKACSSGLIAYCPCGNVADDFKEQNYVRRGCSDNIQYGQKVSKEWTKLSRPKMQGKQRFNGNRNRRLFRHDTDDSVYAKGDSDLFYVHQEEEAALTPQARMNQHNNRVGRNVIGQMLETKCKCHGVSGACNLKTCWKVLPPLSHVGAALKGRYRRATEVRWLSGGNSAHYDVEPFALFGRVTEEDLVYIKKSPDYCTEDRRVGSQGTRGRACNVTMHTSASCDSMCCGRGHVTVVDQHIFNCHCRYVHCCYVECQQCQEMVERHYCK